MLRSHRFARAAATLGAALLAASTGCSAAGDDPGAEGAAGGGGSGASGTTGGGQGAGPAFDGGTGSGGAIDHGCKAVDVLFVIDDSGSMGDNQKSLIASFPGFAAGMKAKLDNAPSYHVGVVTSDDYWDNATGCGAIGSLVTKTGGPESSNQACDPFASGARYLDDGEPDLASKFACIAQVGAGGADDERPMRGLLDAVKPATNAQGACNAGFSRPDALLVVVIISDEDDVADGCDPSTGVCDTYGSGGSPDEWYDELVAYKNGNADSVVVLSLIGTKLDNPCGAVPASKLLGFTNRFKNGFVGDVCAASYDEFFTQALPIIDEACAELEPAK